MDLMIGDKLKKLRRNRDLTQEEVAAHIGISYQAISKWERGDGYPDITMLPTLADYFGVSTDYLLGKEEQKEKPLVNGDEELTEYLEILKTRPEMRMLFQLSKDATKEDVEAAVRIIEALRNK